MAAMPQIWFPGHKGPAKGPLGREAASLHTVPQRETTEMEQNIT